MISPEKVQRKFLDTQSIDSEWANATDSASAMMKSA
jgi:hypothetical protein